MDQLLCETCGKPLSEKQLKDAKRKKRIPKYCSTTCWGKRSRDHDYDHAFMDQNTELSAYFAGWWTADGHFSSHDKCISVTSKDIQLIDLFSDLIQFKNKVHARTKDRRSNPEYTVRLYGNVSKRFLEMGYTPGAKTGTEFIPERFREEPWLHHFVRGFFDGDGTIGSYVGGALTSAMVNCSAKLLYDIYRYVFDNRITRGGSIHEPRPDFYKLQFSHFDTVQLCEWMYKDATIYLARKRKIYEEHKDHVQGCVPQTNTICSWDGCHEPSRTNGLCKAHYDKVYRIEYDKDPVSQHLKAERTKKYVRKNKDKINKRRRAAYSDDPEKHRESTRKWREENPEKVKDYKREYDRTHREEINAAKRAYRRENHERVREQEKASYERNHEQKLDRAREYKKENKETVDAYNKAYRERTKEKRREYDRKRYLARKAAKKS